MRDPEQTTGELERARDSLRSTEQHLRLLVEQVSEYAIFFLDPGGHVMTWNAGAERIKGYHAEEILGRHFSTFYAPEDKWKAASKLEAATREGRVEDEGWRVRKDGTRFWANVVITALRGAEGELVGFAKVTRDLTDRRRAEEERLRVGRLAKERVDVIAALSEALAGALTIGDVARAVIEQGTTYTHADKAMVYVLDEEERVLELVGERGSNPAIVDRVRRIEPGSGNPVYAVATGRSGPLWVETAEQYDALFPEIARANVDGPRARAFWCVPLVAEERAFGVLAMAFHEPRTFTAEERDFAATFAQLCAQALARARRLEAERAAAALVERLRASLAATLRSIGDAVIATDSAGAVTLMNGVAESLTGWSEEEARGRPLHDVFRIVNEHTRHVVESPAERVLATGAVVGLANHTVLLARDGREIPIDDSGAPIRGSTGAIEGVVLVFRDVTGRKREESRRAFLSDATAALAESIEHRATVANVARLAVPRLADWCAVDLLRGDGRSFERIAVEHVDPQKVALAKELEARYPPRWDAPTGVAKVVRTRSAELHADISDAMLTGACEDAEQLRICRELCLRSAMIVPLVARGRAFGAMTFVYAESERRYDEDDLRFAEELARRCAIAIDNARLYASERRARRSADLANKAKDDFLAIVSHELRTPLNAIMGWTKLLTTHRFDEQKRENALQTIDRNAVAMAQLIDDLLDMSRVISGKMRLDVQPVELGPIISAVIESVLPAAEARGVAVVPQLEDGVPTVMGDPTRLQQVVWNLLSNAVKFTSKGGRVEVVLRMAGSSVEIRVADTGKGIAPAFLPSVFEAFRQEDASASRSRGGLGLGLAITRQLVELHGGRIEARSDGEGKGATFTVQLPVAAVLGRRDPPEHAASATRQQRRYESPAHLQGLRVLVVEDEDDARRLVAAVLEDCGCEVTTAGSVDEAMQRFVEFAPDMLLSDIGMPEQDGYDLIRKVRELGPDGYGDVPAAALTAYVRPEDRRRMLDAGYSMHVPKPVDPADLVSVVATLSRFVSRART